MRATPESNPADLQETIAALRGELAECRAERDTALEHQRATGDVLRVISRSGADLRLVLRTLLETAARLCSAEMGLIATRDGDSYPVASTFAFSPEFDAIAQGLVFAPGRGSVIGRTALARDVVQVADLAADPEYAMPEVITVGDMRTALGVPLLRAGELIGVLYLARQRVEPFTERQIDLLRTFADQAVIAIQNARLLNELRDRTRDLQESLKYQTATGDVLKVISRSTFDLQPVLDTLAETAARLCDAGYGAIFRRDGDAYRVAAVFASTPEMMEAARKYQAYMQEHPLVSGRGSITGRVMFEGRAVHVADTTSDPDYTMPATAIGRLRTQLGVPLLREGEPIGTIIVARHRVEPFSERQIDLIHTFADQAVIAMENARLLTETREALEQQTATAEVLGVINASPGDLAPVFDAMLEKAMRLCEAAFGQLSIHDGARFHTAATRGVPAAFAAYRKSNPPNYGPGTAPARVLAGERVIAIDDLKAEPPYAAGEPNRRALVDLGGARSDLLVALTKDNAVLGFIEIYRQEVRPFSDKQIALLQNFAAQAVIAIENARLLDELRQRQQELRVTFDNMADGVAMFDAQLRLTAWNRNFQELLGLAGEYLAQHQTFDDFIRYLTQRGEFGETDAEAQIARLRARVGDHYRFERTRPDGTILEIRHNPMPGGGFVLIYGDITERKRSEAEIRAARDAAEAAYQDLQAAQASLVQAQKMAALGQLTAGIAHEIKNPLNFVNNFASLSTELLGELKEDVTAALAAPSDEKLAAIDETVDLLTGNLDKIVTHGRRADNIVKSMLEHSRGVSGERRAVDLNALIDEALNLAYHGARAQDTNFNITLERDFASALAPIELAPQEMTRVFLNLFGNGFYAATKKVQAMDGGFRPVLRVATRDAEGGVEIVVCDNGTGIAAEIRDKLFQPFVTTKPTGEGTGLGLSISYDIVTQQHGGTISVESEAGAYTKFTIRLPRRAAA